MQCLSRPLEGPYISSLACLTPAQEKPLVIRPGAELFPEDFCEFAEGKFPYVGEEPAAVSFGEKRAALRRQSGIRHSRSASFSTGYATLVARALIEAAQVDGERAGLAVTSTTPTAGVAYDFESRGLLEGWELVDPLSLPNTIPSAVSTQVAIATHLKAFALTFLDGLLGFYHAFEYATCAIMGGRAESALVVGTEEITAVQELAHRELGLQLRLCEGAAGAVLTRERPYAEARRITMFGHASEDEEIMEAAPPGGDAAHAEVSSRGEIPSLHSLAPIFALATLLYRAESRVVLSSNVPGRGRCVMVMER